MLLTGGMAAIRLAIEQKTVSEFFDPLLLATTTIRKQSPHVREGRYILFIVTFDELVNTPIQFYENCST